MGASTHVSSRLQQGFSAIELMVAIAVLAIVVGIGIPSFQSMLDRSRLAAAADDLAGALRYARSEALQRNAVVTLTDKGNGFEDGWAVTFGATVLRDGSAMRAAVDTDYAGGDISFDGRGAASASADIEISFAGQLRCLRLTLSGSVRQSDGGCS